MFLVSNDLVKRHASQSLYWKKQSTFLNRRAGTLLFDISPDYHNAAAAASSKHFRKNRITGLNIYSKSDFLILSQN